MSKNIALLLVLVLTVSSIVTVFPVKADVKTLIVPDDYPTISLAIENAAAGDTVFVKKGTYHEQTLAINKPLSVIGEDVDETTLNLDPPLVETMRLHNRLRIPVTAITINANNVKLQGLTINMSRGDYGFGSGISAHGDWIEAVGNKIADGNAFSFSGAFLSIHDNSLATL